MKDAANSGVDGLIVVDLPPEEDDVLRVPAKAQGIDIVRLATPTTNEARLSRVLNGASGYLYYVSVAGVTGTKSFDQGEVRAAVRASARRAICRWPWVSESGRPNRPHRSRRSLTGAVVGSAIVSRIGELAANGAKREAIVKDVTGFCKSLADSVHAARGHAVVG